MAAAPLRICLTLCIKGKMRAISRKRPIFFVRVYHCTFLVSARKVPKEADQRGATTSDAPPLESPAACQEGLINREGNKAACSLGRKTSTAAYMVGGCCGCVILDPGL